MSEYVVCTRLLVTEESLGRIIGRGGETVSMITRKCGAIVKGFNLEHTENKLVEIGGSMAEILEGFDMIVEELHEQHRLSNIADCFHIEFLLDGDRPIGHFLGHNGVIINAVKHYSNCGLQIMDNISIRGHLAYPVILEGSVPQMQSAHFLLQQLAYKGTLHQISPCICRNGTLMKEDIPIVGHGYAHLVSNSPRQFHDESFNSDGSCSVNSSSSGLNAVQFESHPNSVSLEGETCYGGDHGSDCGTTSDFGADDELGYGAATECRDIIVGSDVDFSSYYGSNQGSNYSTSYGVGSRGDHGVSGADIPKGQVGKPTPAPSARILVDYGVPLLLAAEQEKLMLELRRFGVEVRFVFATDSQEEVSTHVPPSQDNRETREVSVNSLKRPAHETNPEPGEVMEKPLKTPRRESGSGVTVVEESVRAPKSKQRHDLYDKDAENAKTPYGGDKKPGATPAANHSKVDKVINSSSSGGKITREISKTPEVPAKLRATKSAGESQGKKYCHFHGRTGNHTTVNCGSATDRFKQQYGHLTAAAEKYCHFHRKQGHSTVNCGSATDSFKQQYGHLTAAPQPCSMCNKTHSSVCRFRDHPDACHKGNWKDSCKGKAYIALGHDSLVFGRRLEKGKLVGAAPPAGGKTFLSRDAGNAEGSEVFGLPEASDSFKKQYADVEKYCHFHRKQGHSTVNCRSATDSFKQQYGHLTAAPLDDSELNKCYCHFHRNADHNTADCPVASDEFKSRYGHLTVVHTI